MVKTNRREMIKKSKLYFDPWESIFEGNPMKILERGEVPRRGDRSGRTHEELGRQAVEADDLQHVDHPLPDLIGRIDWSPFFATWELRGRYPQILDDPEVGPTARSLHDDALAHRALDG